MPSAPALRSPDPMLKVGELAALANLTVRTLHHYDEIGLLRPQARSDAGYRLYSRDDVARLHRIQALRAFGMRLADIGLALDTPEGDPLAIVDRQLAELDERIAEANRLRRQLLRLRGELVEGSAPDMSTWLTTLELSMDRWNTYEKYFTREELGRLTMLHDEATRARWQALIEQASGLMQSDVPPDAPAAKAFALRWLTAFEESTLEDPALQIKLNRMTLREQEAVGLPAPLMQYVFAASGALKHELWAKYMRPEALARMARHTAARALEWHDLVERVLAQRQADPDATSPQSCEVGRAWLALFHDMVGDDPRDVDAFRRGSAAEPVLRMGTAIKEDMLDWLRRIPRRA